MEATVLAVMWQPLASVTKPWAEVATVSCSCCRTSLHFAKQPRFRFGKSDIYPISGDSAATSIKMDILCSSS